MERYYEAMAALVVRIMRHFAVALQLPIDFFDSRIDRHTSALRVLNYPALDTPPLPGQLRAGGHTDYGTVTVLKADAAPGGLPGWREGGLPGWWEGGLEVELDDRWVPVPVVEDSFIVNLGDAMARWTNDRWRSTLHRVVVPPAELAAARRQSIAFFHNANWDTLIECIPSCLQPGESPRYAPVTAGEHLMAKFRSTQY
jgi:isopenicillin N synthase-like dioxygenase